MKLFCPHPNSKIKPEVAARRDCVKYLKVFDLSVPKKWGSIGKGDIVLLERRA